MKPICVPLSVKLVKKARPVVRCVLERHRIRAGLLAGCRKALQQSQQHQHDRRCDADLPVGRQRADQERRDTHQQQRERQDLLAPELVADVAHEEGADRARHVADAERRERGDGAQLRVDRRKEDLAEHQRGGGAVDEEVVVLDGAADPAGEGRLLRRANGLLRRCGGLRGRGHEVSRRWHLLSRRSYKCTNWSKHCYKGNPLFPRPCDVHLC
jgi:hypothetical protein